MLEAVLLPTTEKYWYSRGKTSQDGPIEKQSTVSLDVTFQVATALREFQIQFCLWDSSLTCWLETKFHIISDSNAVLCITVRYWKQPKCSTIGEYLKIKNLQPMYGLLCNQ